MPEAPHNRLAQILGDIESRCAKYRHQPLSEAQQWADDNWWGFGGDKPLMDLVILGCKYCNLHGLRIPTGLELSDLGAKVDSLKCLSLDDRVARDLSAAVRELLKFARDVLFVIDGQDSHNGPNGEPQSGQVTAKENVAECDGPAGPRHWRHNGQVLKGTMRSGAWRMASHLWRQPHKTDNIYQLIEPVYGDSAYRISKESFQSLCRDANKFFAKNGVPWKAGVNGDCVSLTATE